VHIYRVFAEAREPEGKQLVQDTVVPLLKAKKGYRGLTARR